MGQLPHIIETPLGPGLFCSRDCLLHSGPVRLPRRSNNAAEQAQKDERGGDCRRPVPPHEFRTAVGERVFARPDGQRFQVTPEVFGELLDRLIAALGFFAQRHQHDVVEIAAQPPPQTLEAALARPAGKFTCAAGRCSGGAICFPVPRAPNDGAGLFRLRLANRASDVIRRLARKVVG